jgi:hypothetical protein
MVPLAQLWLPILLSAVLVFFASSILHMVLKFWHQPDCSGFSNEDEVRAAVRNGSTGPGIYMVPYCNPAMMKQPEMQQKFKEGPIAFVFIRPSGQLNMAAPLIQWFLFCLLVSLVTAHIAGGTLAPGTPSMRVFCLSGLAALMGHAFGAIPMGIWWGHPWRSAVKHFIDGIIYALIVGGVIAWFWPQ